MKIKNIAIAILLLAGAVLAGPEHYFKIKVIDAETGRGVPMVELRTLNQIRFLTDSNGYIAFYEPGLMNENIYFRIIGQGYEQPPDFLGQRGVALKTVPGDSAIVRVNRTEVAERMYRSTGAGIYRDSELLGIHSPIKNPLLNGRVLGQDSNLSLIFRNKIFWIWGDTHKPDYPLGNLSVSAATSELPENGGLSPSQGVDYTYFVDSTGFSRKMIVRPGSGFVWFDWVVNIPNESGDEMLVAKYARVKGDFTNHERGIAVFNEDSGLFETRTLVDAWLPDYHSTVSPVWVNVAGERMLYFTSEFYFQRQKPTLASLSDAESYESFTCLLPGAAFDEKNPQIERNTNGKPVWGWKRNTAAIDLKRQQQLIQSGALKPEHAWLHLTDIATGDAVTVNRGSLYWNEYRKRWIMIAGAGVGEVWFAEAETPLGPWVFARKVADHDQLLYNPVHHPFFDENSGRDIYFEGTFSNTFLPNQPAIPRYEYNQLMYRLRLDDPRLHLPSLVYATGKNSGGQSLGFFNQSPDHSQLQKIAFLAFAPEHKTDGLVPVFQSTKKGQQTLSLSGKGEPLFYALPPDPAPFEQLLGKWRCTITDQIFFTREIELNLAQTGDQLSATIGDPGMQITQFRTDGDSLFFSIQYFDKQYRAWGKAADGKMSGNWVNEISGEKGILSGSSDDFRRFPMQHKLLAPLYEFVSKDGKKRVYSTAETLDDAALIRAKKPLCRVWQFPGELLILDASAKPVKQ